MIKNIKSDVLDEVHEELEKVKEEMENIDLILRYLMQKTISNILPKGC